jgi:RNA polymerase sigma factor (sigma-70 family)
MSRKGPPVRARNRIACINFERTLPAFEEHEEERNKVWGQYECLDCGGRHDVPGLGLSLVCSQLSADEGKKRATGRIDAQLARAKGQYQKVADNILEQLSIEIAYWAKYHPRWGKEILSECLRNPALKPFLTRDMPLPDNGHNRPLPENAGELIYKHLPLVRRLAKERATTVSSRGYEVNDTLFSDLEEVGVRALEAALEHFDPTRGITFGVFVRKRVAGAMDNYLARERIRTINGNGISMGYDFSVTDDGRTAKPPKRNRASTGGYREKAYISTSVRPANSPSRLIAANRSGFDQVMEAALAKLNARQREVYRGRVLSDPPVSRSMLAAKLGIQDDRQVPRIEKQARLKMAKLLKVSPL